MKVFQGHLKLIGAALDCNECTLCGSSSWRVLRSTCKNGRSSTGQRHEALFSPDGAVSKFSRAKCCQISLQVLNSKELGDHRNPDSQSGSLCLQLDTTIDVTAPTGTSASSAPLWLAENAKAKCFTMPQSLVCWCSLHQSMLTNLMLPHSAHQQ